MGTRHLSETELTEYADGQLDPRRAERVREHLRACARCARAAADAKQGAEAAQALQSVAAPANLRARVAAELAREPAPEMTCRKAGSLIQEYLEGGLEPWCAVALERHLERCEACRAETAALAAAMRVVRRLPSAKVPSRVRDAVAAARREQVARAPRWIGWRPAVAGAFAVLAIGALAVLRPGLSPRQQPTVAALPEERPAAVNETASAVVPAGPAETGMAEIEVAPTEIAEAETAGRHTEAAETAPEPVEETPKGPAPARTTAEPAARQPVLPSALAALRTVAQNASHEGEVRRAMERAGERFAVLHSEAASEAALARVALRDSSSAAPAGGSGLNSPDPGPGAESGVLGAPEGSARPGGEGAALYGGPFA